MTDSLIFLAVVAAYLLLLHRKRLASQLVKRIVDFVDADKDNREVGCSE